MASQRENFSPVVTDYPRILFHSESIVFHLFSEGISGSSQEQTNYRNKFSWNVLIFYALDSLEFPRN